MSKRRTRKNKESAHHSFTLSWQPEARKKPGEPTVKGQFKNKAKANISISNASESADILAKAGSFELGRRDILKSLILASFILGTELVIYSFWSR